MRPFFTLLLCCAALVTRAGDTLRVLFIGNSYTDVNNLPSVVSGFAAAGGDYLYYQASVPGGYTFEMHSAYPNTLNLISQGNWDYVVLQEQSQRPSFSDAQVADEVYPYARKLDSLVHVYNPCGRTVFYMTWGRKNGDASNCAVWPPVCTYNGMDSLLQLRYTIMANEHEAWLSPVAKVWRRLRDLNPSIELYQTDESHPTPAGTFAAAASFYSVLFGKDPTQNSYTYSLGAATAGTIKEAAKVVVFDSLDRWRQHDTLPVASFTYAAGAGGVQFTNTSTDAVTYAWNFGDGSPESSQVSPLHGYAAAGTYTVCLKAIKGCDTDVACLPVQAGATVGIAGLDETLARVTPNPFNDRLQLEGLKGTVRFRLYNATGQEVLSGEAGPGRPVVDVPELPAGMYFLHLYDVRGHKSVLKLVRR